MDFLMGSILPFAPNWVPKGWMACDGALLPIAQYSALFSLLGTQYGGDGIQTFALPNFNPIRCDGTGAQGTVILIICVTGLYPSRS